MERRREGGRKDTMTKNEQNGKLSREREKTKRETMLQRHRRKAEDRKS